MEHYHVFFLLAKRNFFAFWISPFVEKPNYYGLVSVFKSNQFSLFGFAKINKIQPKLTLSYAHYNLRVTAFVSHSLQFIYLFLNAS